VAGVFFWEPPDALNAAVFRSDCRSFLCIRLIQVHTTIQNREQICDDGPRNETVTDAITETRMLSGSGGALKCSYPTLANIPGPAELCKPTIHLEVKENAESRRYIAHVGVHCAAPLGSGTYLQAETCISCHQVTPPSQL
jgi:hypothetical protein